MATGIMAGLLVVDLSQGVAGPYCTKLLADCGAEVIKVEPSGEGDPARRSGPFPADVPHLERSGLFLHLNTNKKGITLDLTTASGQRIARDLVGQADLLVEAFGPGQMEEWGLSYGALAALNTYLVYVSISDYGQTGPHRQRRAAEVGTFARSGWMHQMGYPGRAPLQGGGPYAEYMAGLWAASGALLAWHGVRRGGPGLHVDVSIQEAAAASMPYFSVSHSYTGVERVRGGHRASGPTNANLPTAEGFLGLYNSGEDRWQTFCRVMLGRPDLLEDPRFATPQARLEHADELEAILVDWLKDKRAWDVFLEAQGRRLLFAVLPTVAELQELPPHKERGYFVEREHPSAGRLLYTGPPFRYGSVDWEPGAAAPTLGQHNVEVLCGRLGYSRQELVALARAGVV